MWGNGTEQHKERKWKNIRMTSGVKISSQISSHHLWYFMIFECGVMLILYPYHLYACDVFEQTCGFYVFVLHSGHHPVLWFLNFQNPLRLILVAGSNLLHVVVPGDFAGRLIGKKGAHVQERPGRVDMRWVVCEFGTPKFEFQIKEIVFFSRFFLEVYLLKRCLDVLGLDFFSEYVFFFFSRCFKQIDMTAPKF